MNSVFFKVVDLLTAINDFDKRGYKSKILSPNLIDSLVMGAVDAYNKEFGAKPPQQPSRNQVPTNDGNQTEIPQNREEKN